MEGRSEAAGEGALKELLARSRAGDTEASEELYGLLYNDLRSQARALFAREAPGNTLQPTALVHEAYMRLFGGDGAEVRDREHIFSLAAKAMRRVLIDRARAKRAQKRTPDEPQPQIDIAVAEFQRKAVDLLALDEALERLCERSPQLVEIVELRFFIGLSVDEVAELMHVSSSTVARGWVEARAWLRGRLA